MYCLLHWLTWLELCTFKIKLNLIMLPLRQLRFQSPIEFVEALICVHNDVSACVISFLLLNILCDRFAYLTPMFGRQNCEFLRLIHNLWAFLSGQLSGIHFNAVHIALILACLVIARKTQLITVLKEVVCLNWPVFMQKLLVRFVLSFTDFTRSKFCWQWVINRVLVQRADCIFAVFSFDNLLYQGLSTLQWAVI